MKTHTIALASMLLLAGAVLLLTSNAGAEDNSTPETAAPLDQYNHITQYVNGTNDSMEYWYWMDIARGQELFVYFYGNGTDWYNRSRILYYVHGPDSYANDHVVHAEAWYNQKQQNKDNVDVWSWICPSGGRYYFHFFAYQRAKGDFFVNISRESPVDIFRFGTDHGTLWWNDWTDLNKNDIWRIWLKVDAGQVEGVRVTLTWSEATRIHLYAYDLVDEYQQNLLNISYAFDGDRTEVIHFTASYTGWYYVRVEYAAWSGSAQYTLTTREYSAPNDGDNDQGNATHVLKTASFQGRLEASRDMHDWFTVDLLEGDLLGISMQIMDPYNPTYNPEATNLQNFFEIQVYDPNMRRVTHGYDRNGGWPVPDTYINNLPIQGSDILVNGTYYIRASFSHSYGYYYEPDTTSGHFIAFCDYVVQITIPNRPPRINQTALADVVMLEDTTWWDAPNGTNVSNLDLWTVFSDPEQGVMTFKVRGDENVTTQLIGDALTLNPRKDWNGESNITLRADDDSGNTVGVILHVLVLPVNDPPRSGPPMTFTFQEDDPSVENRTFDLYSLFYDVDVNDAHALAFSAPSNELLTVSIDQSEGTIMFTPAEDLNGERSVLITATDSHGTSVDSSLKVHILPVNDPPKAREGEAVYTFKEGFALGTFDAADYLFDPDGDTDLRWYVGYLDPADETILVITNEGREVLNSVMLVTPASGQQDWFGSLNITVMCEDPGGLMGEKGFTITITNVPDPPSIASWNPKTNPTIAEGESVTLSVDSVKDPDGPDVELYFSFRLRGPGDLKAIEVQNTTSRQYMMTTDHDSEGVYTVSVVVFDEGLLSSINPLDWTITVTKTNRAPTVSIKAPKDGDTFKEGKWVDLSANVSDPDVEDLGGLLVEWYEGEQLLGTGRNLSLRSFRPGEHMVTVVVTDRDGGSSDQTVTFNVNKAEEEPGFGLWGSLLAILTLATIMGFSRKRAASIVRVPKW